MSLLTSACLCAEDLAFFNNVTNLWFQGHKSNVLTIADERLAINSNDIAGLVLKVEYDLEFTNLNSLSNSIERTIATVCSIGSTNYASFCNSFATSLRSLLDDMASDPISEEEMEIELAKSQLMGKHFLFERRLWYLCLCGFVTNYPSLTE